MAGTGDGGSSTTDELLVLLSDTARRLIEADDLDDTLQLVVDVSPKLVDGCDDASMTFTGSDGLSTPAATSASAYELDRHQQAVGEGPCLSALRDAPSTTVEDIEDDGRWPRWREHALASGYRSLLALRLFVDGDRMGALNLYSRRPEAFDDRTARVATVFASHAAVAMKVAINVAGLERALASRDVIGQAKGILMEREGLDGEAAFARLRELSGAQGAKLRDVAEEIARTGTVPS